MIELRTGIPGSGKTLSMVEAMSKFAKRWEKHPQEARPVFVHNIKDLAFPFATMPTKTLNDKGREQIVPDWDAMPEGSLVVIDECQDVFPPRSSQGVPPPHVAWLNTHRHKGFDIWVTTQNPKLIDFSVRALVGKHVHFRRLFGGQRAATYEWDGCSDSLSGMKDSVMSFYSYPKKAFEFYKSAEVHTKQSFKLPRWLIIPILGVALGIFAIPRAYSTLTGAMSGKVVSAKTTENAQAPALALAPTAKPVPIAPVVAQLEKNDTEKLPVVFGCIKMATRCECFDDSMSRMQVTPDLCEEASHRVGVFGAVGQQTRPKRLTTDKQIDAESAPTI